MDLITTTGELAEVCARMARHPFVTVDTEFLRETTYYPLLCVAQLASPDEAVVIDALAPGIDLAPAVRADDRREGGQGVPRRAPGHRNRLEHGEEDPASDLRQPGRRHGARLRRLRSPTTSWCSASPATSSTSRTASPTGRGGRCPTRRSPTRSPTSRICARSISSSPPIWPSANAPAGSRPRWACSPRPKPTASSRNAPGSGSRAACASPRNSPC